jgi:hypothetical protein
MARPRQGAPIVDRHDWVISREGRRISLIGDLIEFHGLGEGSRGHEILHHVVVHELVLDGVGVVSTSHLQELLEVARGWPCLMLATTYCDRDMHHARATHLLVVAIVTVGCGCGFLKMPLVPLPTALGTSLVSWVVTSDVASLLLLRAE